MGRARVALALAVARALACAALVLLLAATSVGAQPIDTPPTWGGDLLSRPRLTGSWGGVRDEMAKKGIVFDVDVTTTGQGVVSGGRDHDADAWGNVDYTLNFDTQKAGLWPGGFFKFRANTGFGYNIQNESGALVPVNTAALLPAPNDQNTALLNATFMQFLSPKFGVVMGKIFTFDLVEGEFAGDYQTQFMNTGLVFPMNMLFVPVSAYGGGPIFLPTKDLALSAVVLDPNGTPLDNNIANAFDGGAMVIAMAKLGIKPFGLPGHQIVTGIWSDKERVSLQQDPSNLFRALLRERFPRLSDPGPLLERFLTRFFPGLLLPVEPLNKKNDTWLAGYTMEQYLWQPDDGDPHHGIGVFFNFAAADGNPNPIQWFFNLGIGGRGVVPGRPNDSFGVGWARSEFSNDILPIVRNRLNVGLDVENDVELYYNAALTPWLEATLDLQIIDSGLNKRINGSGNIKDMDTAIVPGLRVRVRF
jgi:porin